MAVSGSSRRSLDAWDIRSLLECCTRNVIPALWVSGRRLIPRGPRVSFGGDSQRPKEAGDEHGRDRFRSRSVPDGSRHGRRRDPARARRFRGGAPDHRAREHARGHLEPLQLQGAGEARSPAHHARADALLPRDGEQPGRGGSGRASRGRGRTAERERVGDPRAHPARASRYHVRVPHPRPVQHLARLHRRLETGRAGEPERGGVLRKLRILRVRGDRHRGGRGRAHGRGPGRQAGRSSSRTTACWSSATRSRRRCCGCTSSSAPA